VTQPGSLLWLNHLSALAGGLFLLGTLGIASARQVQDSLRFFVLQSLLLCASAFLLGLQLHSVHVLAVGVIDLIGKPILVPWLLRRTVSDEVFSRREVTQVLSIPVSLLIAAGLMIAAYVICEPMLRLAGASYIAIYLPVGLAGLFVGAYAASVRREAVPLFLGLLAMENAALFAGIAIAPGLPVMAEIALAFDMLAVVFVFAVLTRAVHEHIGTTEVGRPSAVSLPDEEAGQ
jgi:hydrogenase-4 component E